MNYYEELGIPNTAPEEEVRRAYRSLARLLHPDQQSDEALRRLAGIQMARLNEVLETLTDPKLRLGYDASLRRQAIQTAPGERVRGRRAAPEEYNMPFRDGPRWGRFAWPGAGVLGIALIALFLAQDAAVQRPTGDGEGYVSAAEPDRESGAWPVRTEARLAIPSRVAQDNAGKSDTTKPEASPEYIEENDRRMTEGRSDSGVTDGSQAGSFGGGWYFSKAVKSRHASGMCPPVYIDMEISESRGEVTGKYSARYLVGERPISPFVEFQFAGAVRESAADLGWSGSGGAAGRVRLTLLSARQLRVEWTADQVGAEMGLASGMATLVRRGSP